MTPRKFLALGLVSISLWVTFNASAGTVVSAARQIADVILAKFGRGAAGETVDQVSEAAAKAIARHGDAVVPLLRNTGHVGFKALETAADKAPEVIKLYQRSGNEAVWIISEPKKLAIFIKHGDSAADALIKHPGIADSLIERFGGNAATALNGISRQSAQRLAMIADDGLLSASARSPELLPVIRQYGDHAMEFIWKNKGALTVAAVLGTFLADPPAYISGAKQLVDPIAKSINWILIFAGILVFVFLPFIARFFGKARRAIKEKTGPVNQSPGFKPQSDSRVKQR